ncbi:bifunctional UDP-N-acetylglucosamine diphosphorylase/glucosamine-1-phosphate N-acetyltransferase GlmU [soil metagenome]
MNDASAPPLTAVVLAAGRGTRMRSRLPKVLHPVCGRPMLEYVLSAAGEVTGTRPLVVISPATQAVREAFMGTADFAVQDEPRGTADALRAALAALPEEAAEIVVLSGDVPLVDPALVRDLASARGDAGAAMALVSVDVAEPGGLGRVVRDGSGGVTAIVEARDASADELAIDEVNAGLYAFDVTWLRRRIEDIGPSAVTGEVYLTELVRLARMDDRAVACLEVEDDGTLLGINDRAELADAEVEMRLRINERHMRAGVTIVDPATAFIEAGVEIAPDVTLEPFVMLGGATRIGPDSRIRAGSQIIDALIGRGCVIWASILEASVVGDGVRIGPFAHVRGGSQIDDDVELGNYAEVKNSRVGRGTKSHHFSYLGDADVGAGVNVGAGTITANYDGHRKHRTRIGDRAFIGSDTILRAPVSVGQDAVTGAGSVVTHDVPDGTLVMGVPARPRERPGASVEPSGTGPGGVAGVGERADG